MPSSGGRTIRRATSADLALLADLHLRLVEDQTARGWRGSPMTPAMERDYIARRLHRADVHYLIAEAAGQPIGYIEAGLLLPRVRFCSASGDGSSPTPHPAQHTATSTTSS